MPLNQIPKLRRSVLYMPGSNPRALEKAHNLDADVFILDLEDAVAPEAKASARELVSDAVKAGGYRNHEVVVRINGLDTEWGKADINAMSAVGADAILLPKVETRQQLMEARQHLIAAGGSNQQKFWMMAETPRGILDLDDICMAPGLEAIVLGTSDLAKELRIGADNLRQGLINALSHSILVARAHGLDILDGVYPGIEASADFVEACEQGLALGFDGKTLIHPRQIATANEVFGISEAQATHAEAMLVAWQQARDAGEGVAVLDGKLIEQLHIDDAERILALYNAASK
ncbi:MAG: CoA ester lyase [Gammaproteobacteria bacterium]|nr:CoA ester lyase [Gammaproteobacteria bacterium]